MMKFAAFTLLLALAPGLSAAQSAARGPITIASEGASPPWTSINADGVLVGYDIDVGKELCLRMKRECRFVAQDWDGIIPALTVGKYDAIMSGMAITEKRKKSIAFSRPYAGGFNQLVVRKDLGLTPNDITSKLDLTVMDGTKQAQIDVLVASLKGKTLGVLRSSNSEAVLNALFSNVATVRSYDSQDNLHLDLAAERIDGGLADFFTWKTFLDSPEGQSLMFYGPQLSGGLWGPGVGVGIRKDDSALIEEFDTAIAAAQDDGKLKQLSLKWFGIDISPVARR